MTKYKEQGERETRQGNRSINTETEHAQERDYISNRDTVEAQHTTMTKTKHKDMNKARKLDERPRTATNTKQSKNQNQGDELHFRIMYKP